MKLKLTLSQVERTELIRLIDEEEPIDEVLLQKIRTQLIDPPERVAVQREDLEDLMTMLPISWVDIHNLTNPNCAERVGKKGKVKPCLTCKLSQRREKAIKNIREVLGMPLAASR